MLGSIPLTSAADPSLDVGALPLWPGASFRVYRGFAPASLGTTGHLGGVLAIDPPSAAAGERTEWWAAAGSFGSLKLRAGDMRRAGGLTLGTGIFASRSDGDFPFEMVNSRGEEVTALRRNARSLTVGGISRASLDLGWGTVSATLLADARQQGLPGLPLFPAKAARLDSTRIVSGADVVVRTARGAWRAAAWGRRETSELRDPRSKINPTRTSELRGSEVLAAGGSIGWRGRALPTLLIGPSVDARAEGFRSEVDGRGGAPAGRLAGGLGLDIEWKALEALTVSAAGRFDARRDASLVGEGGASNSTDAAPSGHVGASYRVADTAVVSSHVGALYRPPSFFELFGDHGALIGDPSLRPERALSVDAGLHGDVTDSGTRLGYEVVGFVTYARDLIAFLPLGWSTFRARNVEQARIIGLEVSGELAARGLVTSVSYTLLATENLSDDPLSRGRPLPGRPLHDLAYDASYKLGPARAHYALDVVAGTTVDTQGTRALPARVLHGAGVSLDLPWARGLVASIEAQNLFDLRALYVASPLLGASVMTPVSDFLGFPLPGRTLWATLRFRAQAAR